MHECMTTGKTISLTRQTFVDKVITLLFNMLSRLVITFLPRSKRLLIAWLQLPAAVILEPKKINTSEIARKIYETKNGGEISLPGIQHTIINVSSLFFKLDSTYK